MEEFFSLLIADDVDAIEQKYPIHILTSTRNAINYYLKSDERTRWQIRKNPLIKKRLSKNIHYNKTDRKFIYELL